MHVVPSPLSLNYFAFLLPSNCHTTFCGKFIIKKIPAGGDIPIKLLYSQGVAVATPCACLIW